ncbi:4-hydroxy-tetrahydrodipicolinate reductase [Miniphocaeibacter halophilus]|uniref:4-hydroxy-tetrahydrodipicolinate reductase n=1 Tax=Miniphocaeibacter halophilus TaxID=2931922 RepID=A0AC61MRT4_9FIRM|nr:4-hydroxy-tetrahydrodipicolinate reductase [Miniphocaeibacter halophilus]QQK07574.1 4-hydroxy-tetrahydrodipicolinate reductase [Miniphocaeibacter halophilus]
MNILLIGATGSMGKTVEEICSESKDFKIVAGIGLNDGKDHKYPIYSNFSNVKENCDVILDFSNHNLITDILNYAIKIKKPLVISTTGYTDKQVEEIENASNYIPILFSGNMSLGINILLKVVENLSKSLLDFDIEIIEKHHKLKKDSPSGTARMLFNSVNLGRDNELIEKYGREGTNLERANNEVGIHSVRGGTIVGEHTVLFSGEDEILEVTHKAQSKKIFAFGALKACKFIIEKENNLYSMRDIFDF